MIVLTWDLQSQRIGARGPSKYLGCTAKLAARGFLVGKPTFSGIPRVEQRAQISQRVDDKYSTYVTGGCI